jgi:hypothetical protein
MQVAEERPLGGDIVRARLALFRYVEGTYDLRSHGFGFSRESEGCAGC